MASGGTALAALLYTENPSIATTSIPSLQWQDWSASYQARVFMDLPRITFKVWAGTHGPSAGVKATMMVEKCSFNRRFHTQGVPPAWKQYVGELSLR